MHNAAAAQRSRLHARALHHTPRPQGVQSAHDRPGMREDRRFRPGAQVQHPEWPNDAESSHSLVSSARVALRKQAADYRH